SEDDHTKLYWYSRGTDLAKSAVAQDDGNADAHFALFANWGRWLQTDGWLKNAYHLAALRRELDRALQLNPNHPDALAAMGGLYLELPRFLGGNVAKAEPFLVRAIQLDPLAVGARLELADCYLQQRQDGARDLANTARRLAIEQGKPHFVRRADALLLEIGPEPAQGRAGRCLGSLRRPGPLGRGGHVARVFGHHPARGAGGRPLPVGGPPLELGVRELHVEPASRDVEVHDVAVA